MQLVIDIDETALRRLLSRAVAAVIETSTYNNQYQSEFSKHVQRVAEDHLMAMDIPGMVQRVASSMAEGLVRKITEEKLRGMIKREIKVQAATGELFDSKE